jgi:hypothetical protein
VPPRHQGGGTAATGSRQGRAGAPAAPRRGRSAAGTTTLEGKPVREDPFP